MRYTLLDLESKISDFFEKHVPLSTQRSTFNDLILLLFKVIDEEIIEIDDKKIAPNIFTITIDEQLKADFSIIKDWMKDLQNLIEEVITENNLIRQGPLTIQIIWKNNQKKPISIIAERTSLISGKTIQLNEKDHNAESMRAESNAILLFTDGEKYILHEGLTTIGREMENDLTIDNLLLSRLHARITIEDNQTIITDLNSINGTFVNGNKIDKHILFTGDVITLGDVSMIYITEDDESGNNSLTTRKMDLE